MTRHLESYTELANKHKKSYTVEVESLTNRVKAVDEHPQSCIDFMANANYVTILLTVALNKQAVPLIKLAKKALEVMMDRHNPVEIHSETGCMTYQQQINEEFFQI